MRGASVIKQLIVIEQRQRRRAQATGQRKDMRRSQAEDMFDLNIVCPTNTFKHGANSNRIYGYARDEIPRFKSATICFSFAWKQAIRLGQMFVCDGRTQLRLRIQLENGIAVGNNVRELVLAMVCFRKG